MNQVQKALISLLAEIEMQKSQGKNPANIRKIVADLFSDPQNDKSVKGLLKMGLIFDDGLLTAKGFALAGMNPHKSSANTLSYGIMNLVKGLEDRFSVHEKVTALDKWEPELIERFLYTLCTKLGDLLAQDKYTVSKDTCDLMFCLSDMVVGTSIQEAPVAQISMEPDIELLEVEISQPEPVQEPVKAKKTRKKKETV